MVGNILTHLSFKQEVYLVELKIYEEHLEMMNGSKRCHPSHNLSFLLGSVTWDKTGMGWVLRYLSSVGSVIQIPILLACVMVHCPIYKHYDMFTLSLTYTNITYIYISHTVYIYLYIYIPLGGFLTYPVPDSSVMSESIFLLVPSQPGS